MRIIFGMVFCLGIANFSIAQGNREFGLKGGLNLTFFNVTESTFGSSTDTAIGFYFGAFTDFEIDDAFSLQPELLVIGIGDYKFINAPIYAKYEVAHHLDLMVGPSLNYFFDFFVNKFKVRGDIAVAYEFIPKLDVHMKYTLGFKEIAPNGLFFGLGYRF